MEVTKLEAAADQLDTAIDLYFQGGHEVATHTLVGAAYELIRDLLDHQGREELLEHNIIPERRGEMRAILRKPQNFLKHADRDPEATLELNEKQTEIMLLLACAQIELFGPKSDRVAAYLFWFTMQHPDLVLDSPIKSASQEWRRNNGPQGRSEFFAHALEVAPEARRMFNKEQVQS